MPVQEEHSDDVSGSGGVRPGKLSALLQELVRRPAEFAWDRALGPGVLIGRFELVREVGRGGFGVVWEARDRDLGRRVAFKAVQAGSRRGAREERLLAEAEAAARLQHPNIVTLHDVGRSEHGPYLILELLQGKTLADRLGQGTLPVREAVRIGVEIAKGLAHAHSHGVVHRDLKPENVFLCDDGQVKVLDFGMAHAFGRRRTDGGTPSYMAPEQFEGAPEDERTDVFALGVILFEMLTGRPPFEDERALRSPSAAPALDVPGAPAVGELVVLMLEKSPVDRPRDGAEVLSALSSFSSELERAPPAAGRVRTRRRSRLAGSIAAAIGIAVAVAGAGAWWLEHGERSASERSSSSGPVTLAVLPLANLSSDAAQESFSDGMTEEIIGKLSRIGGLAVTARTSAMRYKGSSKGARDIGRELGVAYLVEGSVRRAGDRIRVSTTLVKTADAVQVWSESVEAKLDDIFEVQERVATRIVESLHVRLAPGEADSLKSWGTRNAAAYEEYLRGQALVGYFHAHDKLEMARGHFERALRLDPGFAPAMAGLASAEAQMYRNVDSKPDRLERARALVERALEVDPRLTRALFATGEIRGVSYDYVGAAEMFRRVTQLEPRNFLAWDYLCWSLGYVTPPRVEEAEKACRKALELNPVFPEPYYHLARVLIRQGRMAEAEDALRQLAEQAPGDDLASTGWFWVHMAQARPGDAIADLERSPDLAHTGLGWASRAMALAQLGKTDRAFGAMEEALKRGYRDAADLRSNPYYDPLRRDPRFARILAKHYIDLKAVPVPSMGGPIAFEGRAAAAPTRPSIAVLPFADMSPRKDQEYFADGVAEEILNALAQVEGLHVTGRTSSFAFKGRNEDLRTIGQRLNVSTLLEGSVRKEGRRVRITAEIVNVADGYRLWTQAFDRELTSVFAVQEEIAQAVVAALRVKLLPGGAPTTREVRTRNPEVYRLYLLGRDLAKRGTPDEWRRALAAYEQALALDPEYAPAWAGIAFTLRNIESMIGEGTSPAQRKRAVDAADRAIALAPELPDGYWVRAWIRMGFAYDWSGADADLKRARALSPSDADVVTISGQLLLVLGRLPEAIEVLRRATVLDPLSEYAWARLGVAYTFAGDLERGREALRRSLDVVPAPPDFLIMNLVPAGRPAEALAAAQGTTLDWIRDTGEALALRDLGRQEEARAALERLITRHADDSAYQIAEVLAWHGERDRAFEWLERAYAQRDTGLQFARGDLLLRSLHRDERWKPFLRKLNLPAE